MAPSLELLVGTRVLQGVGGALLTHGSLAILQASFHPDDRAQATGAWSGLGGVATAIGPFLGGWLIQAVSWRLIFFINLPLVAAVVLVSLRHAQRVSSGCTHFGRSDRGGRLSWLGHPGRRQADRPAGVSRRVSLLDRRAAAPNPGRRR